MSPARQAAAAACARCSLAFKPASTLLHSVQCCVCCFSLSFSCLAVSLGPAAAAADRERTEPAVGVPVELLLVLKPPGRGN